MASIPKTPRFGGAGHGQGRKAGSKNKATLVKEQFRKDAIAVCVEMGVSPLEIMMTVARGGANGDAITERQFEAAKAAAPYIHPKLQSVNLSGSVKRDAEELSDDELAAIIAGAGSIGGDGAGETPEDSDVIH